MLKQISEDELDEWHATESPRWGSLQDPSASNGTQSRSSSEKALPFRPSLFMQRVDYFFASSFAKAILRPHFLGVESYLVVPSLGRIPVVRD